LVASQRGKIRTSNMFVITDDGRIEYVGRKSELSISDYSKFNS
ncbi:MAG: hypothetical protein RL329_1673, partial [Bacteroidota bacterium]